jgi:hypothetical protein
VETAASWRFAAQNQNSILETGGVEMVDQEVPDRTCIQCDDIEIVDI